MLVGLGLLSPLVFTVPIPNLSQAYIHIPSLCIYIHLYAYSHAEFFIPTSNQCSHSKSVVPVQICVPILSLHSYFKPVPFSISAAALSHPSHFTSSPPSCVLPCSYQWRLDSDRSGPLVSVSPISGVIQPFEGQYHQWTFSPRESQPYKLSAVLHVSATNQIKWVLCVCVCVCVRAC